MRIVPAVDIRGGLCVNLVQGDFDQETVYSQDPVDQAQAWWDALLEAGQKENSLIHMVDLDGARSGECCILPQLKMLARRGIPYEVGGGIRSLETVEQILEAGATRVILGTAAYRDSDLLEESCRRWPEHMAVGIDARAGQLVLSGWLESTDADALEFARRVGEVGASRIIYTDILSDGMLSGPNQEMTGAVARESGLPVTLSGGVASLDDIHNARALAPLGVDEVIVGRALYVGRFTVDQAVRAARERP